jgi:hypothetical protein
MNEEKRPVDWSTYDRISSTDLQLDRKSPVLTPFKGIIIGQRQFLGILDYIGYPLFVALLFALCPLFGYKSIAAIDPSWLGSLIFYGSALVGLALAIPLFFYLFRAKKTNDREGTASVYLNLETRELGLRDYNGQGKIIPLDQVIKPMIFRLFSLQVGPLSLKLYARLILEWKDGDKKRITIVHFMSDPEETAQTIMAILHEKKPEAEKKR